VIAVTASSVASEHGSQVVFADLDAGRVLRRMDFGGWGPRANFSRDGRRYALGGFDGRLAVVDVATGAMSGPDEPVHEGPISGVAFSPDGATLASLGFDGQVLLADAATGALQARIRPGRPNVEAGMTFLDDGRTLVVAYGDGSMLSYDTDPSAWISHACAVAGRNLTHSEWRTAFGDRAYRKTCPGNPG
jgi:WD40 repeat protein